MNVTLIIPAAGLSNRNPDKLLYNLDHGKTVIETSISKFIDFPINIIVVVGHQYDKMKTVLKQTFFDRIQIINNLEYKFGIGSSLRKGVSTLSPNIDYFGFHLGDKPFIRKDTVNTIYNILIQQNPKILQPSYDGISGHPNFFSVDYKNDFLNLSEDYGGKYLIKNEIDHVMNLPLNDKGITLDMDEYLFSTNK